MAARNEILPPGMRDPTRRILRNPIIKDTVVFEKYGAETGGEYTQTRVTVSPGGGTPLHYHTSYAEHMMPQKGTLGVVLGEESKLFEPGEKAVVPIGTKHRFFNPAPPSDPSSKDIEFIGKVVPAHENFEKSIYICYGLANDGLCDEKGLPKSIVHLCLMADLGDMLWPGLTAGLGNTFVRMVAAYGRWMGEEEKLVKKYWH